MIEIGQISVGKVGTDISIEHYIVNKLHGTFKLFVNINNVPDCTMEDHARYLHSLWMMGCGIPEIVGYLHHHFGKSCEGCTYRVAVPANDDKCEYCRRHYDDQYIQTGNNQAVDV